MEKRKIKDLPKADRPREKLIVKIYEQKRLAQKV